MVHAKTSRTKTREMPRRLRRSLGSNPKKLNDERGKEPRGYRTSFGFFEARFRTAGKRRAPWDTIRPTFRVIAQGRFRTPRKRREPRIHYAQLRIPQKDHLSFTHPSSSQAPIFRALAQPRETLPCIVLPMNERPLTGFESAKQIEQVAGSQAPQL